MTAAGEDAITITDANDASIAALRDLASSYFPDGHRARDPAYLRWLYCDNPLGRARVVVCNLAGLTTAMVVLVPAQFLCAHGPQHAYIAVNGLSHPEHRGRGLFGKMITRAHVMLTEERAWLIGYPNDSAIPTWRRTEANFRNPFVLRLVRPGGTRSAGGTFETVADENALWCLDFSALQSASAASPWPRLPADPSYLAWRFFRHPLRKYEMRVLRTGSLVDAYGVRSRVKPGIGILVDWQTTDRATFVAPTLWSGLTLAPAPVQASPAAAPLLARSMEIPGLHKQYAFFATYYGGAGPICDDWGAFTFAATDFT